MAKDTGLGCGTLVITGLLYLGLASEVGKDRGRINELNERVDGLSQKVKSLNETLTPITQVVDGRTNQFYQIGEQKAYTLIDGKPIILSVSNDVERVQ